MGARTLERVAVVAAIAVVGAASIAGFLDRVAWPFELATIFRLQYAGVLLVLALPALLLGARPAAAAAVLLSAVNLLVVAPWTSEPAQAAVPGVTLRLLLANVEIGNDNYDELARLVHETRPDAVGVTELDPSWARELARRLPGFRERLVVPRNDAYGIGLLARVPLAAHVERFPGRDGPPTIVARLHPPGAASVTLVVTHVHTFFAGSVHERHIESLAAARPRLGKRLAICGDFNTVPWAAALRRLAATGLTDLYRGSWPGYSWPTWNPLLRVPLDNCLVGGVAVRDRRHLSDIGSDHYPLLVDLAVPTAP